MRKFTLTLLAALSGLFANAQVSSVDDLVGIYSATGTGTESVTDYTRPADLSSITYDVEISKNNDGTINIDNILNQGNSLTASVDIDAKTITIEPGAISWATFASSTTSDGSGSVVATFDDDATISITNFGAWIYKTSYVSDDATITLTKANITKDWEVKGHMVLYNYDEETEKSTAYFTQEMTLTKYTGSSNYDYILDFGEADAIPTNMKFTVGTDGSISITNIDAYYNTYYVYDLNENLKCLGLYTADDYSYFEGNEESGELLMWSYGYSDYSTLIGSGYAYFSWDTADGITSVAIDKAKTGAIYDLTGRKVTNTSKAGIYIKNGKKFIVK